MVFCFAVYREDVLELCTRSHSLTSQPSRTHCDTSPHTFNAAEKNSNVLEQPWKALVLLIPVRLGGETLNPVYIPAIQTILAHDMCLGIIGGRPKHSVFFIGWQGEYYSD